MDQIKPSIQVPRPDFQPKMMVISLLNRKDQSVSRVFRLNKDRIVLGSVVSADVRLTGDGVSPLHAVLEFNKDPQMNQSGVATIYDLASDTGVFVNNQKVVTLGIADGALITIGNHLLRFGVEDLQTVLERERERILPNGEKTNRPMLMGHDVDLSAYSLEDGAYANEIFDYRPCERPAIEVVLSWYGTILDVEHYADFSSVRVGSSARNDFVIPPFLGEDSYRFLSRVNPHESGSAQLWLDERMTGVVQKDGMLHRIEDIRRHLQPGVPLEFSKNDFAKIQVGTVTFYLSFTAAPPKLKTRRDLSRDPIFFRIMAASLGFTALFFGVASTVTVPTRIEAEQLPDRIATILYQPEKFTVQAKTRKEKTPENDAPDPRVIKKPKEVVKEVTKLELTPKPVDMTKPIPKEMAPQAKIQQKGQKDGKKSGATAAQSQAKAKEGEGARAKGPEGTRGSKTAKNRDAGPQNKAYRPSPMGGEGRGSGKSQVPEDGNIDMLKMAGGKIESLLGNSAAKLGKGGEKLKGFGGFDTVGKNGLGLSGSGSGGGGESETLAGGLGKKGFGGGKVGTGMGAAGDGSGLVGGKSRVSIRSGGPEEVVVEGAIDRDAIRRAIEAHLDEFRHCYNQEINAENPEISGTVIPRFIIGASGRVTEAGVHSSSLGNPRVEGCVIKVLKRIDFPIPRGSGLVDVKYPFKFGVSKKD